MSDLDVALSAEVVDFRGLDLADDVNEAGGVSEIPVVQGHLGTALMFVVVEMLNPGSVEGAGTADDAVHIVTLGQQKLGQVRPILPCDSGDQGDLQLQSKERKDMNM